MKIGDLVRWEVEDIETDIVSYENGIITKISKSNIHAPAKHIVYVLADDEIRQFFCHEIETISKL